ncbi:RNA pol II accessory factor, Cdc73 family-domain-containing protein [Gamsiella multidivaricata]|uniref:RNA pol II accessory factor, Cdc73 family-domain-containing protein n=1 Tax=Gamsiella multidivaricata TaxID=101098 RepID=UPI0022201881|nr:RNA pol II accessory factor, Cdc73 family-domain-containing protein [Gamsiella multidivaricata]KAG0368080.1 accessory factor associated with RNA polymerase II [Gamsiella multidivaricata]KAI7816541.1 RNA pol II accessory factor, Cdc73 family-domain-containing protein [Gamsiella multidivaricata]
MSKTDPLSLLREFTVSKKPITLVNANGNLVTELTDATDVVFADDKQNFTFPRGTPTNYKKNASDETYTLETLLFLLQRAHQSVAEYSLEGAQKAIPIVSILDKRGVLEYLTGAAATSAQIIYQVSETNKRSGDDVVDDQQDDPSKRQKTSIQPGHGDENEILRLIISKERLARTTASVLRGNKSFANIQKLGAAILLKSKSKDGKSTAAKPDSRQPGAVVATSALSSRPGSAPNASTPRSATSSSQSKSKSSSSRIPIIIIPAAVTSMLTMYNIKQFLEDQIFMDSQEIRSKGDAKPTRLTIERRQKANETHKTPYHVIDSADHLRPEDWDRVICVFTTGAEWQFKKWKWQKPVELFAHVKGFYVKWADEQPKDSIKSWNVEVLSLNRHRRHADRAVVTEFWDRLQGWCLANKPYLAY